jgi:hypothetical protein
VDESEIIRRSDGDAQWIANGLAVRVALCATPQGQRVKDNFTRRPEC